MSRTTLVRGRSRTRSGTFGDHSHTSWISADSRRGGGPTLCCQLACAGPRTPSAGRKLLHIVFNVWMVPAARSPRLRVERRYLTTSGPQRPAPPGKLFRPFRQAPAQLLIHFLHATLAGPPIGMLKGVDGVLVRQVSDFQSSVMMVVGPLAFSQAEPGRGHPDSLRSRVVTAE